MKDSVIDDLQSFYGRIAAGDIDRVLAMFSGVPSVNTPLDGQVKGEEGFRAFAAAQRQWLSERKAHTGVKGTIITDERVVLELTLHLELPGGAVAMPVALVADVDGGKVADLRVYHSTYPLTGNHMVRTPMLEPRGDLAEPPVIEEYMRGLARGDARLVLALFTPTGYIREPSGEEFKHQGPEGLAEFYEPAFRSGGIPLKHCTATFDGKTFAVEFTIDRWGRTEFDTMAGMAIYQLTDDGRKIEAVRIYDDVTPPGPPAIMKTIPQKDRCLSCFCLVVCLVIGAYLPSRARIPLSQSLA